LGCASLSLYDVFLFEAPPTKVRARSLARRRLHKTWSTEMNKCFIYYGVGAERFFLSTTRFAVIHHGPIKNKNNIITTLRESPPPPPHTLGLKTRKLNRKSA
jgi:hypothetical protein